MPLADATIDYAATTFVILCASLVLLMTVPALALFYGGMTRAKSVLNMMMMSFGAAGLVGVIYVLYGYSMSFGTENIAGIIANPFEKFGLAGTDGLVNPFGYDGYGDIPELALVAFQMTFAIITVALISGAIADRVKFGTWMVFAALWVTLAYFPMAHMVWGGGLLSAADGGLSAKLFGATDGKADVVPIDFAGGTVVHINAGMAGLVLALIVGVRLGFGKVAMRPHNVPLTMIGAGMLWVGWFGFNAGSNLAADGIAALAAMNTFVATAAAAMGWVLIEWLTRGHPSLLGAISGMVAGLVAVTPAAGFAGPIGAIVLGLVAGVVCFFFCTTVKNTFKYDDSLDVFGVHCIGGIIGAIGTAIVADPGFTGQGWLDYAASPGTAVAGAYDITAQLITQAKAVGVTLVWSGLVSAVLYYIVHFTIGMRVTADQEREGLDISTHGERAYNM
jgi:Amt family ammonium transporter